MLSWCVAFSSFVVSLPDKGDKARLPDSTTKRYNSIECLIQVIYILVIYSSSSCEKVNGLLTILTQIVQEERLSLVILYFATNGAGWAKRDKWLTGDHHCDWFGVDCNSDGYVENLSLVDNQLKGSIPASIGNLKNLRNLELSTNNELIGSIPESIGKLEKFNYLNLFGNDLKGSITDSIDN